MYKKLLIVLVVAMYLAPIALAGGLGDQVAPQKPDNSKIKKLIAHTISPNDKAEFKKLGCTIYRELEDATAIRCPDGVVEKLNVKVEEDAVRTIQGVKDNTQIQGLGAVQQIGADMVWTNYGYTGAGVVVAVIDTGIDFNHQELQNGGSIGGKSFVDYTTSYLDDHGHGTHVAGIITSDGIFDSFSKGAAPDASVWAGKVCNSAGSCQNSDIAAAIEYVIKGPDGIERNGDEPADIISMSLGGGGTTGSNCDWDYLASKVNWAVNKGVTVVVAAGNSGIYVSSPACASGAISVGAVDGSNKRASFSGKGKALDIMAPGVNIYSTTPGNNYAAWSGTSMATPYVTATVALMKQKNPSISDTDIKNALYKNAKDLGKTSWDQLFGWGRVDALKTITS